MSRGLVGSVERGPRALFIRSTSICSGKCAPATLLKMSVAVASRSDGPVASGRPRSQTLFLLLQSSVSSMQS